jgi:hypothetical protein
MEATLKSLTEVDDSVIATTLGAEFREPRQQFTIRQEAKARGDYGAMEI